MFNAFVAFLIISMIGCNEPEFEIKEINIVKMEMTNTAMVNSTIDIHIRAQANSGCYSNLNVTLNQLNNTSYQILATGKHDIAESFCPTMIVALDTTITFTPTKTGKYIFIANKAPFSILYDTLIVN